MPVRVPGKGQQKIAKRLSMADAGNALSSIEPRIISAGFSRHFLGGVVYAREDGRVRVVVDAGYLRSGIELVFEVASGFVPTIEDALQASRVLKGFASPSGPPIPAGVGQIRKARAVAVELAGVTSTLADLVTDLVIPCHSAAVRRGWRGRTVRRRYTRLQIDPKELRDDPTG